ncbi:hypothetical protein MGMO_83c00070 [Methyloglobulus morosus KoM1]|uniref:Uncharacterized protein n=1 Tax=Methyloglobulus morosus KoM1 TaxID=1116472 RepID=V5BVN1_9GAMM|nr:hypothetical protein MGMO_83c00070 [Methyloglobulus morosus KoM1]
MPGRQSGGVIRETAKVKYTMIKTNETLFPVGMICSLLSVSCSGYYAWKRRPRLSAMSDFMVENQLIMLYCRKWTVKMVQQLFPFLILR